MNKMIIASPGYVYIGKTQDGLYKIGSSTNPAQRAKTLKLQLVHTIPTDRLKMAEFKLHGAYMYKWVRGECFALSDVDIKNLMDISQITIGFSGEELAFAAAVDAYEKAGGMVDCSAGETSMDATLRGAWEGEGFSQAALVYEPQIKEILRRMIALEKTSDQVMWGPTNTGDVLFVVKLKVAPTWRRSFDATRAAKAQEAVTP